MSMLAPAAAVEEFDLPYLTVGGATLLARVYRPTGAPKAALVDIHGGTWNSGDRFNNTVIDRALAAAGFLVAAVDFRAAQMAPYPASVADANAAVRWLKAQAGEYGFDPARVGALGSSSGGHQMLLNALRPRDPVFAQLPCGSDGGASLSFAVACWPIADPLARYHMAKERGLAQLVRNHDLFFGGEATMIAGNPQLILERGEQTHLPPLLVIQGTADENVATDVALRFTGSYRIAGGQADLHLFPGQQHAFITRAPEHPDARRALDLIVDFVAAQSA